MNPKVMFIQISSQLIPYSTNFQGYMMSNHSQQLEHDFSLIKLLPKHEKHTNRAKIGLHRLAGVHHC